jgi:hypothetical protein
MRQFASFAETMAARRKQPVLGVRHSDVRRNAQDVRSNARLPGTLIPSNFRRIGT